MTAGILSCVSKRRAEVDGPPHSKALNSAHLRRIGVGRAKHKRYFSSSSSRFDSHLFLWSDNFCIRRPTGRRRIRAVWNRKCLCIRISYYSSIWRYCTRIRIWRRIREKETKDVTSASWLTPDNKKGELWQKPQSTTSVFSTYFRLFSTSLEKREREKEKSQQRDIYRTQQTPPPTITVRHNCVTEQCRQCWPTRIHFPPQLGQKHYPVGVYKTFFFG